MFREEEGIKELRSALCTLHDVGCLQKKKKTKKKQKKKKKEQLPFSVSV